MDALEPREDLLAQRAALETEVARLKATLARLEARLSHDEARGPHPSGYAWGLMFGLLALVVAGGGLYYAFMNVMSLD